MCLCPCMVWLLQSVQNRTNTASNPCLAHTHAKLSQMLQEVGVIKELVQCLSRLEIYFLVSSKLKEELLALVQRVNLPRFSQAACPSIVPSQRH